MTHNNFIAGNHRLGPVEVYCAYPDGAENNCCPTGFGTCCECEFCKVEISARDFDVLLRIANGKGEK